METGKVIINGKVILPDGEKSSNIVIGGDGIIEDILETNIDFTKYGYEVIDAKGNYVVPGGVDAHVHLVDGYEPDEIHPSDDCYTGSMAAIAGGTTTVIDFVSSGSTKKESAREAIADKKQMASNCVCDYAFQYSFTERYEDELKALDHMIEEGITSFKVFTYYEDKRLDRGDIMEVMEAVKDIGMLKIHAEAFDVIKKCEKRMDEQNRNEIVCHSLTRPNISELLSVRDMIALQRLTGAHICIAHVSTKDTIDEKAREMALGGPGFTIETCPHYLAFTRERMREEDGGLYTMAPPLRSKEDSDAIWQGILDGRVDFMATDHCPFSSVFKLKPGLNYHNLPYGVDGIQTRVLYLFSEGVKKRGLSMERFVQLTAENTAKNYKMYPQKGCIAIGSDADIVFIDPDEKWTYSKDKIIGSCDYTIFEGWEFEGKIDKVFSRGELVYDNGKFDAKKGRGQFVRCQ